MHFRKLFIFVEIQTIIDMNTFLHSQPVKIVRWIAAVPLALLGAWGVYWFNNLIFTGPPVDSTVSLLVVMLLYALAGYAFTAIGVYVVPDHKRTVSIVLTSLLTIGCISAVLFSLPKYSGLELFTTLMELVSLVGGALCMSILYYKGIINNK